MGPKSRSARARTGSLAPSSGNCGESPITLTFSLVVRRPARLDRRIGPCRSDSPPLLCLAPTQIFPQRRRQTLVATARFSGRILEPIVVLAGTCHGGIYPTGMSFRKPRHCLAPPGAVWQFPPRSRCAIFVCALFCCRSSVVEHPLGKGEVECSIHSGSTILFVRRAHEKPRRI